MNSSNALIDPPQDQTLPSRCDLIAAFKRVIARKGRPQATDLHVRRLLCYVRAKDVDGQGVQRSQRQLADRLVLSISTCRRVIRRAVEEFGLLIVTPQRHVPGGQTVNRYRINRSAVTAPHATPVPHAHNDSRICARVARTRISKSRARSKRILSLLMGNTDMPVRLGPPVMRDHLLNSPVSITLGPSSYDPANEVSDVQVRLALPVGSSYSITRNSVSFSPSNAPVLSDHPPNSPVSRRMPVVLRLRERSERHACRATTQSGLDSCYDPVRPEPTAYRKSASAARTRISKSRARSKRILSLLMGNTDMRVRLGPPVMRDHPLNSPVSITLCPSSYDRANEESDVPVVLRPRTACPLRSSAQFFSSRSRE